MKKRKEKKLGWNLRFFTFDLNEMEMRYYYNEDENQTPNQIVSLEGYSVQNKKKNVFCFVPNETNRRTWKLKCLTQQDKLLYINFFKSNGFNVINSK